jgi:hypothetical protein
MGAEGRGGFLLHTVYTILGGSPFLVNRNFQIENSPCRETGIVKDTLTTTSIDYNIYKINSD